MYTDEGFWQRPPWREAKAKHRLGLTPTTWHSWTTQDSVLLNNKRVVLEQHYDKAVAVVADAAELAGIDAALRELAALLSLPRQNNLYPDLIANIASELPQDICVLDLSQQQRLVAGCVCAPSYWVLLEKIGKPLHVVHALVDGMNQKIGVNIESFIANMPIGKPFSRQNWFTHASDEYFAVHVKDGNGQVDDSWVFRSEQQLLFKVSVRYVIFFIRVVFQPVKKLRQHAIAADQLLATLRIMDADEIRHFGGLSKYQSLLDYVVQIVDGDTA